MFSFNSPDGIPRSNPPRVGWLGLSIPLMGFPLLRQAEPAPGLPAFNSPDGILVLGALLGMALRLYLSIPLMGFKLPALDGGNVSRLSFQFP